MASHPRPRAEARASQVCASRQFRKMGERLELLINEVAIMYQQQVKVTSGRRIWIRLNTIYWRSKKIARSESKVQNRRKRTLV